MSATMSVKEVNGGATPVATTITNCRLCTADLVNPLLTYPLVKPESGLTNFSYKKTVYLNADTAPSGTINNVKFYPAGEIGWTGVDVEVKAVDTYTEPDGTPEVTGDDNNGTDIGTYSSGSPLALTGSLDNPSTGKVSQYLEIQGILSDAAVAGALDPETCTFRYDET